MAINSKQKGSRGERDAVKLLKSLGFDDARRGQQFRGSPESPDVECLETLPNIHFEIKWDKTVDFGTKRFNDAMQQAIRDAGTKQVPVMLWKHNGKPWRLTWLCDDIELTTTGEDGIRTALHFLNDRLEGQFVL